MATVATDRVLTKAEVQMLLDVKINDMIVVEQRETGNLMLVVTGLSPFIPGEIQVSKIQYATPGKHGYAVFGTECKFTPNWTADAVEAAEEVAEARRNARDLSESDEDGDEAKECTESTDWDAHGVDNVSRIEDAVQAQAWAASEAAEARERANHRRGDEEMTEDEDETSGEDEDEDSRRSDYYDEDEEAEDYEENEDDNNSMDSEFVYRATPRQDILENFLFGEFTLTLNPSGHKAKQIMHRSRCPYQYCDDGFLISKHDFPAMVPSLASVVPPHRPEPYNLPACPVCMGIAFVETDEAFLNAWFGHTSQDLMKAVERNSDLNAARRAAGYQCVDFYEEDWGADFGFDQEDEDGEEYYPALPGADDYVPQAAAAARTAVASLARKNYVKEAGEADRERCLICADEFKHHDSLAAMPCNHSFHGFCLEQWLDNSHMCPTCRYALPAAESETKSDEQESDFRADEPAEHVHARTGSTGEVDAETEGSGMQSEE
ncbi:hypothetical protein LTR66_013583 [Elasticomyces elasticus]|nr:hypothetical protein LTR66_013583 [Elasticomyces elasticus]